MRSDTIFFVGRLERKRPLGKHVRGWEDNIMDFR
jgi:hypothetical protein